MGIIFILGMQDSSKDAITEVLRKGSPKFEFAELSSEEIDCHEKDMKKFLASFNKDMERFVSGNLKEQRVNIMLNMPVTVETDKGYMPVLREDFFDAVRPDVIILVEDVPGIKMSRQARESMAMQQELDMEYAAQYSSIANCPLKIIEARSGGLKGAIKEVQDVIKSLM